MNRDPDLNGSKVVIVACLIAGSAFAASASDLRIGSMCEASWGDGYKQPLPPEKVVHQRALAEQGDVQAQYFMGVVTANREASNVWLKRAIANGSTSAAAYYAFNRDERLEFHRHPSEHPDKYSGKWQDDKSTQCWWPTHGVATDDQTDLLKPIIAAAEAGEPQPATWLWQIASGATRFGPSPTGCEVQHPLINSGEVRKWMEIAGRGGNAWAQEALCAAYSGMVRQNSVRAPEPSFGFPADSRQAFYWCAVAANNQCARGSLVNLSGLYQEGIGTEKSKTLADYWSQRWRRFVSNDQRNIEVLRPSRTTFESRE